MSQFMAAPEAKELTDIQACHFVMNFAAGYFRATIATLGPRDLREIVLDIIPRKVSIEDSTVPRLIPRLLFVQCHLLAKGSRVKCERRARAAVQRRNKLPARAPTVQHSCLNGRLPQSLIL